MPRKRAAVISDQATGKADLPFLRSAGDGHITGPLYLRTTSMREKVTRLEEGHSITLEARQLARRCEWPQSCLVGAVAHRVYT